jgi:glycosyltransferase involved in cell wall biosynthesis
MKTSKLRILLVHNRYQRPGGEDISTFAERDLLLANGHDVKIVEEDNHRISGLQSVVAGLCATWNPEGARRVKREAVSFAPDIVHFHNTFPLISPAAYYGVSKLGIPVVQTLHNYRLLCANAQLFREGVVCEKCIQRGSKAWGIVHACYRNDRLASAAVSSMLAIHDVLGTWRKMVTGYIALTEFAKAKFVLGGLPEDRIHVKPNFIIPDPGFRPSSGEYAVYAGRLSEEKGVRLLLKAWEGLGCRYPLVMLGDGPLRSVVEGEVRRMPWIKYLGHVDPLMVLDVIRNAKVAVIPSQWFEGAAPRVLMEALAVGTPAIVANLGCMAEFIRDGENGLVCSSINDVDEWRKRIVCAVRGNHIMEPLRIGARNTYLKYFAPNGNYAMLMEIYKKVRSL